MHIPLYIEVEELSKNIAILFKEKIEFQTIELENFFEVQFSFESIYFYKWIDKGTFAICYTNNKQKKLCIFDVFNKRTEEFTLYPNIMPLDLRIQNGEIFILFKFRRNTHEERYCIYNLYDKKIISITNELEKSNFLNLDEDSLVIKIGNQVSFYYINNEFKVISLKKINLNIVKVFNDLFIVKKELGEKDLYTFGYCFSYSPDKINYINDFKLNEVISIRYFVKSNTLLLTGIECGEVKSKIINILTNTAKDWKCNKGEVIPYFIEGEKVLILYSSLREFPHLDYVDYKESESEVIIDKSEKLYPTIKNKVFNFKGNDIYYWDINGKIEDKVFLYLHGGPHNKFHEIYSELILQLVNHNYRVICVDYPGSSGYGEKYMYLNKFDWGGIDLESIIELRKELFNETTKVTIYGVSYGGYLSLLAAAKYPKLWDKVISVASFNDISEFYYESNNQIRKFLEFELGSNLNKREFLKERSPYYHPMNLAKSDLLLIHGEKDEVCRVNQSKRLYKEIKKYNHNKIKIIIKKEMEHQEYSENTWANDVIEFLNIR